VSLLILFLSETNARTCVNITTPSVSGGRNRGQADAGAPHSPRSM
jgi:hypothetical protein